MKIDLDRIKNAHGYEFTENSKGELCQLVTIDEMREINKKLKAIEIIKEKGVDILLLKECKRCKTPNQYNKRTSYIYHKELTQEEYELLKEVLL